MRLTRPLSYVSSTFVRPAILLALLSCVGCGGREGPERVPVHGIVTINGDSLLAGAIRFIPTDGTAGPAAVGTIQDGEYDLSSKNGPIIGKHRVEIEASDFLGFEIDDEEAFVRNVEHGSRRVLKNPIPAKYNKQTTLKVEVTRDGEGQFDFPLDVAQGR